MEVNTILHDKGDEDQSTAMYPIEEGPVDHSPECVTPITGGGVEGCVAKRLADGSMTTTNGNQGFHEMEVNTILQDKGDEDQSTAMYPIEEGPVDHSPECVTPITGGGVEGCVAKRLADGSMTTTNGNQVGSVPPHVQHLADQNPGRVTMMEWKPKKTFDPLDPADLERYQNYIHREFMGLLRGKGTDEDHRKRLKTHEPIWGFAERHPILFEKLTTRDIATNPRLMYPLRFNLHIRAMVLRGEITEDQGKGMVAAAAMQAVVAESVSRGIMTPERGAEMMK